jgi:hypothetical protein
MPIVCGAVLLLAEAPAARPYEVVRTHDRTTCASERSNHWIVFVSLLVFVFVVLVCRFTGPPHEGLNLFEGDGAIFVGIHRLEDSLMSGLEFLQRNSSVTVAIHQSEDEAHGGSSPHHATTTHHVASPHHAASASPTAI